MLHTSLNFPPWRFASFETRILKLDQANCKEKRFYFSEWLSDAYNKKPERGVNQQVQWRSFPGRLHCSPFSGCCLQRSASIHNQYPISGSVLKWRERERTARWLLWNSTSSPPSRLITLEKKRLHQQLKGLTEGWCRTAVSKSDRTPPNVSLLTY